MHNLFSIIIPCYNQGHYLRDTVLSLFRQDYENWEAIIVNDGSIDNTTEVAKEFIQSDSRIRLISKENGGLPSARNTGIQNAKGDWFIFLDADDYLDRCCLSGIYENVLNAEYNTLLRYGYTYVSYDLKSHLHTVLPPSNREIIPSVFNNVPGPCHSICISRVMVEKSGLFDESLRALEDWDFWIRVGKAGGVFENIPKSLAFYRQVPGSMSRSPEIMLESAKIVISRIPLKDKRLVYSDYGKNINTGFDTIPALKAFFIRILGINLFKGDITSSVSIFERETRENSFSYSPPDFSEMRSALTFRYAKDKEELKNIIDNVLPVFRKFFHLAGFSSSFTDKAIACIFGPIFMKNNIVKYGALAAKVPNLLFRIRHSI